MFLYNRNAKNDVKIQNGESKKERKDEVKSEKSKSTYDMLRHYGSV